jgi:hypothetical protein
MSEEEEAKTERQLNFWEQVIEIAQKARDEIDPTPRDLNLDAITFWFNKKPATRHDDYASTFVYYQYSTLVREEVEPLLKAIKDSYTGEVEVGDFIYCLSPDEKMIRRRRRL